MRSEFYEKYMKSPEWEEKRLQRMKIDNYQCCMCGRPIDNCRSVQIHHVSYRNLGHENVWTDLATMCGTCHQKIHRFYNRPQKEGDITNDRKR